MEVDDDALGLILERIDSHVSLVRAAAVCKRWRRAIADAAFLRRFRSLHAPAVAGDYYNSSLPLAYLIDVDARRSLGPVFVPASPSIDARHFALDFLPGMVDFPERWDVLDSRGSLLLMSRLGYRPLIYGDFPDMTVCEPLTRRYRKIPVPAGFNDTYNFRGSYLIDGNADEAECRVGIFNFRVFCMCIRHSDIASVAVMFTVDGDGDAGSSWSEKTIDQSGPTFSLLNSVGCAGGSFYFYSGDEALIVLDGSSGEFFSSLFPCSELEDWCMWDFDMWVTEGRNGKLRMFTIFENNNVKVFTRLDNGAWALENSVKLSEVARGLPGYQTSFFSDPSVSEILTKGSGFVILCPQPKEPWFFSIQLDTMEVGLAPGNMGSMVYRCELPWPPALHA